MPLYDITKALRGGDALPFSDDCVLTCRTGHGDIILKFDTGISRNRSTPGVPAGDLLIRRRSRKTW